MKFLLLLSCLSSIGRDGGAQSLTLGMSCHYLGVILHEMTHAAGFYHEQNRWDRDEYVNIHWSNIQPGNQRAAWTFYLDTLRLKSIDNVL